MSVFLSGVDLPVVKQVMQAKCSEESFAGRRIISPRKTTTYHGVVSAIENIRESLLRYVSTAIHATAVQSFTLP